jgi:esterase/lipase superfamily enzyme
MYPHRLTRLLVLAAFLIVSAGCASKGRPLMPTPLIYQSAGAPALFTEPASGPTSVDLLYLTDRGPPTADEDPSLKYGESRGHRIAFGSAKVLLEPDRGWKALETQSRLGKRTEPITMELGRVHELGAFPKEPYDVELLPTGNIIRAPAVEASHDRATAQLEAEIDRRLAETPTREIVLYIHGFNETFASAAYTAAELCHFLGREHLCAFFTWPASHTGNFLISYTTTTESATYAVPHLTKMIRLLASRPGVERVHVLAHSRGTAVALDALYQLIVETVASHRDPVDALHLGEIMLFSPDVDLDIAAQRVTTYLSDPALITAWPEDRLPRAIHGHLTIYTSPNDRALSISRVLFRSRDRLGQISADDLPLEGQKFLAKLGKTDVITYEGKRTDPFGHSYFTSNPEVSSDLIERIRYRKRLGEPGRRLIKTGPVTWEFPPDTARASTPNVSAPAAVARP